LAGCVLTLVCVAQLLPEEEDDMWHVYNLIGVGDHLEAVTVR
jgi:stalled ribosome rescue protein Dom34